MFFMWVAGRIEVNRYYVKRLPEFRSKSQEKQKGDNRGVTQVIPSLRSSNNCLRIRCGRR
jgi:hypothetical protein